ncbi:MAG TPA: hypothetical protein VFI31_02570 [Pirellulales bacterium]|nr:hypothetical protein [Pirellulales bacterium]
MSFGKDSAKVTVNFDIFPRQALAPSDFKALGRSIRRWLRLHAKQQGSVHWYDSDSLDELLKGRPPLAVQGDTQFATAERAMERSAGVGDYRASGAAVLDADDSAPPPFCLSLVYNKIIEDRQIFANVHRALSPELAAEVLVNGRSWDEPVQ